MKFALAKEHRDFFTKHGWIEFDGVLPLSLIDEMNKEIDRVLAERLKVVPGTLHKESSESQFLQGRDLWRMSPVLLKSFSFNQLGMIICDLFQKKSLRLAYDQLFPSKSFHPDHPQSQKIYENFLDQSLSLENVSAVQGIIAGVMIALDDTIAEVSPLEDIDAIDPFPAKKGSALFFSGELPIHWKQLYLHSKQRFYLVVYTDPTSFYRFLSEDPHAHALKHVGYIFNDKLTDRLNPLVYR